MERKMMIDKNGKNYTVVACVADEHFNAAAPLCFECAFDAHLTPAKGSKFLTVLS